MNIYIAVFGKISNVVNYGLANVLPSKRTFAIHLGTGYCHCRKCYSQLLTEGYISRPNGDIM